MEDLNEEPITGNSLLFPYAQCSIPQLSRDNSINPRVYTKATQSFVNQFWKSWLRNMPSQLLLRSKWFLPRQNLKTGDYVIILEPGLKGHSAPRGLWQHAVVVKTFPSNNGLVRKNDQKQIKKYHCFGSHEPKQ